MGLFRVSGLRHATLLFLCILFHGCAQQPLVMSDLDTVSPGDDRTQLNETLKRQPRKSVDIEYLNRTFTVLAYPMATRAERTSDYIFILEDDMLLTWGYLIDLKKEEDEFTRGLAMHIAEVLPHVDSIRTAGDYAQPVFGIVLLVGAILFGLSAGVSL